MIQNHRLSQLISELESASGYGRKSDAAWAIGNAATERPILAKAAFNALLTLGHDEDLALPALLKIVRTAPGVLKNFLPRIPTPSMREQLLGMWVEATTEHFKSVSGPRQKTALATVLTYQKPHQGYPLEDLSEGMGICTDDAEEYLTDGGDELSRAFGIDVQVIISNGNDAFFEKGQRQGIDFYQRVRVTV